MKTKILALGLVFLFLIMTNSVIADTGLGRIKKSKPLFFSFSLTSSNHAIETNKWDRIEVDPGTSFFVLDENDEYSIINEGLSSIKCTDVKNIRRVSFYGQREDISSGGSSESLAEIYLKRLAEELKNSKSLDTFRGRSIISELIFGGISVAVGTYYMTLDVDPDDRIPVYLLMGGGGLFCISGILSMTNTSRGERELNKVLSISNLSQRERVAHKALASLAAGGKTTRVLGSMACAAYCVLFIVATDLKFTGYGFKEYHPISFYLFSALMGGLAASILVMKTAEEKAFKNYLKESKQRKELRIRLGIDPYGGARIGFVLSF